MKLGRYLDCNGCAALVRRYRREQPPTYYCRLGYPMRGLVPTGVCPHPQTRREIDLARTLYGRPLCRYM